MTFYNLMSGAGFEGGAYSSQWIMGWVGLALIIIIFLLAKKWLGEEEVAGVPYNWIFSGIGVLLYIFMISFTGSGKWSFVIALIGILAGGFGGGMVGGGDY